MGSQLAVVCVAKYPEVRADSRFYRHLLKLLGKHTATGSQGYSTPGLAVLRVCGCVWILGTVKSCLYSSLI